VALLFSLLIPIIANSGRLAFLVIFDVIMIITQCVVKFFYQNEAPVNDIFIVFKQNKEIVILSIIFVAGLRAKMT
jgi:hypothetical protein